MNKKACDPSNFDNLTNEQLVNCFQLFHSLLTISELLTRHRTMLVITFYDFGKEIGRAWEYEDFRSHFLEKLAKTLRQTNVRNFSAWFRRQVKNECIDIARHYKVKTRMENTVIVEPNNPFYALLKQWEKEDFWRTVMEDLTEKERRCTTLFYRKNQSYEEVEAQTRLSAGQVRGAIERGKTKIISAGKKWRLEVELMDILTSKQRKFLFDWHQKSYSELQEIYAIDFAEIASRIREIKTKLQQQFGDEIDHLFKK